LTRSGEGPFEPSRRRVQAEKEIAALFPMFKPKIERDLTPREEEAAAAVAYDYTRKTSRTVLARIDSYRNEKVVPMAAEALKAFTAKLERCRDDENFDRVVALQGAFEETVKRMAQEAVAGLWDGLREWQFTLDGSGLKTELDRYVALTFGNIFRHLEERATSEANAVIERISGEALHERQAALGEEEGSGVR
jgi:hypothetical protein